MSDHQRIHSDAYNDEHLNKGEFGFARLIHQVYLKKNDLLNRGEMDAANKAEALYNALNTKYKAYLASDKGSHAVSSLNTHVKHDIDQARPTLEQHRGWSNLLANIVMHVAFLATAGIGNVVALGIAYKRGYKNLMFPMVNTDSVNKIDSIVEYLEDSLPTLQDFV
jgi:Fe-S cluster biogenesis protein NfuA